MFLTVILKFIRKYQSWFFGTHTSGILDYVFPSHLQGQTREIFFRIIAKFRIWHIRLRGAIDPRKLVCHALCSAILRASYHAAILLGFTVFAAQSYAQISNLAFSSVKHV